MLDEGSETPGVALPGGGAGRQADIPVDKLSHLIQALNDRFGMDLTDADKVWFEQQKQAVKDSDDVRVVALNNDYDHEDAIIDRDQADGVLFNAFFEKPGFRESLLESLGGAYQENRKEGTA